MGETPQDFDIDTDETAAAARRRTRMVRLNTRWVPMGRFVGFFGISVGVGAYQHLIEGGVDPSTLTAFVGALGLYLAVSWVILWKRYSPEEWWDWGLVFLGVDLFFFAATCLLTGGERSPAILLFVVRVADQVLLSVRRAVFFSWFGLLVFLGMVALRESQGLDPSWVDAGLAGFVLAVANFYIAWAGRPLEALRRKNREVMEIARRATAESEDRARELERALGRLRDSDRARQVLLADVSHELRTPIAGILGLSELLAGEELPARTRQRANLIHASSQGLLRLLDDLLRFSRIEEGKFSIQTRRFEIRPLLDEVVELIRFRAEANGTEVSLLVDPSLPQIITSDATRLRQILLNFLTNAVKHTRDGTVELRGRWQEGSKAPNSDSVQRLIIEVQDTGAGMPPQVRDRLFERFEKGDGDEGTGLGLVISKRIVELLGGELEVESELGSGTMVRATVPVEVATGPASREIEVSRLEGGGRRLLVAEDDPVVQMLLDSYLRSFGFEVDVVGEGQSAIVRMAKGGDYAAVLLDARMPVMDGLQTARSIRAMGFPGPIIFVTGNATKAEKNECLEVGDDYMVKPFQSDDLRGTLSRWL